MIRIFIPILLNTSVFAGISISPVLLEINPQAKIATLNLKNKNNKPVYFQVDVHEWDDSKVDKIGSLDSTWIISPHIITIPPQGEQIIRIAPKSLSGTKLELMKRVFVREIQAAQNITGIKIKNNYSLPLFAKFSQSDPIEKTPKIELSESHISITNVADQHIQLGKLASGTNSMIIGGHLVSGEKKHLKLPFSAIKGSCTLDYQIDDKTFSITF